VQVLEGLIAGGGGGLSQQALSGVHGVRVRVRLSLQADPQWGSWGQGEG
jgi:hypothetical protein